MTMERVLQQCGDDFSRDNIMKHALSLAHLRIPVLLPGIELSTGPGDFHPMSQLQLARFNGTSFDLFGEVYNSD